MKIDSSLYHYGSGFNVDGSQEGESRKPLGYTQYSGTICQQSGVWSAAINAMTEVVSVEKGSVMPYHSGQTLNWHLLDYSVSENLIPKSV
ncbi:hypothetical protein M979_2505 [Buttiauxella noackiae ATCC 51607]|uniref:Uncharacterized protein n=1 Tax=Buttiauxella noackiae ATCC 51607 TaxID=1354255 RepID=A0A1B7HM16_9ENTR|nr:hypothetical protein [Buttiauxella noackiae]OAT16686.1 hypothetical protein M979_2505 [Buttiauxella noackiae ATCC 51607]